MRHLQNLLIFVGKCIGGFLLFCSIVTTPMTIVMLIQKEGQESPGMLIFSACLGVCGWLLFRTKYITQEVLKAAPHKSATITPTAEVFEPSPPPLPIAATHITINIPASPTNSSQTQQVRLIRCGYCGGMSSADIGYCQQCRAPVADG